MYIVGIILVLCAVNYYVYLVRDGSYLGRVLWIVALDLVLCWTYYICMSRFGVGIMTYTVLIGTLLLVLAAIGDLYTFRIPLELIIVFTGLSLMILFLSPHIIWMYNLGIAGMVFLVLMAIHKLLRGGIGDGDVYILTLITLILGWQHMLLTFLVALFLTALVGLFMMVVKGASKKTMLPFVPFLAIAHLIIILI